MQAGFKMPASWELSSALQASSSSSSYARAAASASEVSLSKPSLCCISGDRSQLSSVASTALVAAMCGTAAWKRCRARRLESVPLRYPGHVCRFADAGDGEDLKVPRQLVQEIKSGNCIAFLGAGFSAAQGFPGWLDLLRAILERGIEGNDLSASDAAELQSVLSNKRATSSDLDRCAQILEDKMGIEKLENVIEEQLKTPPTLKPAMLERLRLLHSIPFSAILTVNFDLLISEPFNLPTVPAGHSGEVARKTMWRILRDRPLPLKHQIDRQVSTLAALETHGERRPQRNAQFNLSDKDSIPILQLHGSIHEDYLHEPGLALTRLGYRKLLHANAWYQNFMSTLISTKTILYMGFSFSDAYINEMRSSVKSMLGKCPPIAYAIVFDKDYSEREFFARHEGVQFLSYPKPAPDGFQCIDEWLEEIYKATSPQLLLASALSGKKVLFDSTFFVKGEYKRRSAASAALQKMLPGALHAHHVDYSELGDMTDQSARLDVVGKTLAENGPFDCIVLSYECYSITERWSESWRCPIIIFDPGNVRRRYRVTRREECISAGASAYCDSVGQIVEEMMRLFGPLE